MDKHSGIIIGIILVVIVGALAFLTFNPNAREAMRSNVAAPDTQTPASNPND